MNPPEAILVMSDAEAHTARSAEEGLDEAGANDLVTLAQGGDVEAVGQLYDHYHERIFRYVWSRVGNQQQAEDLTGEVFMRMVKALPQFRRTKAPFRAWLFRVARNLLVDYYRKTSGRVSVPIEEGEVEDTAEGDPVHVLDQTLTIENLHRALSKLDRSQHEVVALRFLSGLSIRETANTVGKTEGAVKALQHRGLAALRGHLNPQPGEVI